MTDFQSAFLAKIGDSLGISYEEMSAEFDRLQLPARIEEWRVDRLLKVRRLIDKGGKRKVKRAWRIWVSVHGAYTPSAGFCMMTIWAQAKRTRQYGARVLSRFLTDEAYYMAEQNSELAKIALGICIAPGKSQEETT